MTGARSHHRAALLQAVLVTFLWSTSWILIKVGLNDLHLGPLTFAGLRYFIAALVLLPLAWPAVRRAGRQTDPARRRRVLGATLLLGVILYAITQGAQFAALVHLPSVAVALALSFTPVVIALVAVRGSERPTLFQIGGALGLIAGAALYYGPVDLGSEAALGLAIIGIGVLANAASAMLGRVLARDALPAIGGVVGLTALSMIVGSSVLLGAGLISEGLPRLTADALLIIGWLALVNTAFAFSLWNHTLRTLTAVESSVLNNLMIVQIAALAWLFLGESLDLRQLAGLAVALAGIVAVQLRPGGTRRAPVPEAVDEAVNA